MTSTKFATGKVMCEDFTLSTQRRRQAAEFLRSRGFDEPANCQGPVVSLALVLREGGSLDMGKLNTMASFTLKNWAHAFNKLLAIGVLKKEDGRVKLQEDLPTLQPYYLEPGARFVRVDDLRGPGERKKILVVPKFKVELSEHGQLSFTILRGQQEEGIPGSFTLVPALAYLHVARLKGLSLV